MRLLIVEDDHHAADFLLKGLREAGHTVDHAVTGQDGLFLATTEQYDALVLDRMLPKVDGLTILRTLRASNIATPVLILSALGEVDDRIDGLRAGGDDYLVKPFAVGELLARLDAIQRRARPQQGGSSETTLQVADLEMNLLKRTVKRAGQVIELQPKEFLLLEYLMRHADQVVTRTMLLEGIWNYDFDPKTNVIDVHVSNLRAKIDKNAARSLIHTVRGAGYRLGLEAE
ncbi:MAG: response regulator transcription factor [Steroidobacteraceae bacterium]